MEWYYCTAVLPPSQVCQGHTQQVPDRNYSQRAVERRRWWLAALSPLHRCGQILRQILRRRCFLYLCLPKTSLQIRVLLLQSLVPRLRFRPRRHGDCYEPVFPRHITLFKRSSTERFWLRKYEHAPARTHDSTHHRTNLSQVHGGGVHVYSCLPRFGL